MKKVIVAIFVGINFFQFGHISAAPTHSENATVEVSKKTVEWYWLSSNEKYSKYFDPKSVKTLKNAVKSDGSEVATEIQAWTKTTYTYKGAEETIKNYGIKSVLPDSSVLSYSLALFKVHPQTRMIQYLREDFYNKDNKIIWSKSDGRIKEINSHSFDEDFYVAIVDEVFHQGETDRKNSNDRWIELWTFTNADGETTSVTADTTTMQMRGQNLVTWIWQTLKNSKGQTAEIRFMKKAVNLRQGTERIINGEVWSASTKKWSTLDDEHGGSYRMIKNDEPDYGGLIKLRAFVQSEADWVNRYSISQ